MFIIHTISILLAISLTLIANCALALPKEHAIPGGVLVLPVPKNTISANIATTNKEKRTILIHDGFAIIGIPISYKEKAIEVTFLLKTKQKIKQLIDIQPHKYEEQHITLKKSKKKYLAPDKKVIDRIIREKKEMKELYKTFTPSLSAINFIWPIEDARISSMFGLRRFYNKQPKAPHSGIDLAAPIGTPIKAPSSGTVLAVGDYYFNGNTVFLDHGKGLISMFCHLDKWTVQKGDNVKQGEIIGMVGNTGRSTGPHLHWTISLNTAKVDPILFLPARKQEDSDTN